MKVWFDTTRNLIQIDGVTAILPPLSLQMDSENDNIRMWVTNGSTQIVNVHYSKVQDEVGTFMTSLQEATDYLYPILNNAGSNNQWDGAGLTAAFENHLV